MIDNDSIQIIWSADYSGSADLSATVTNGCGSAISEALRINISETTITSVNENLKNYISIYPNPTPNYLHIETKEDIRIKSISILTLGGQELSPNIKLEDNSIDVSSLNDGLYVLRIATHQGIVNYKFVKK